MASRVLFFQSKNLKQKETPDRQLGCKGYRTYGRSSINTFLYPPITSGGNQRQVLENTLTGGDAAQNAVYPNPATDNIMVNYIASNDKEDNIQIQLTDLLGRVVLQQPIANKGSQKIAIDKLSPGLYFYTIREQNNITLSGKLVKK